jgi:hypothetical protein
VPNGNSFALSWDPPSGINGLQGYLVLKAQDRKGPYQRLTEDLLTGTSLTIPGVSKTDFFMVKAVELTQSASGSYYNSSQGAIYPDPLSTPIASPLQALDQNVSTFEDTPGNFTLSGAGADPASLTFKVLTTPAHGGISGTPPNLTYMPEKDYFGADSFTFSVADSTGESAPAMVQIQVTPVNDPPTAGDLKLSVGQGLPLTLTLPATDIDGGPLTYRILTQPAQGTLTGTPPALTYIPTPGATDSDSFTYLVNDGLQDSRTATVTIQIVGPNHAPSAAGMAVSTSQNQAVL